MKALILALAAFFTFSGTVETAAKTQEAVKVALGKSSSADRGRISVKFLAVVEDSRCPVNANCIWAGNAKIRISVSKGKGSPQILELNTFSEPRNKTLDGYEFELKDLYPQKGETDAKGPITAELSIRRK